MQMISDLKITLIQTELAWENKKKNLEIFEKKISSISEQSNQRGHQNQETPVRD